MSGPTRGCGCTGRAGRRPGPAARCVRGHRNGPSAAAAGSWRQRAGSECHGQGAGLGTGKNALNQCLGEAVVSGASRPGEGWQQAAGSAELFLAAAGAGERA